MTTSAKGTAFSIPKLGSNGAINVDVMTREAVEEPCADFNAAAIKNGTNTNAAPVKIRFSPNGSINSTIAVELITFQNAQPTPVINNICAASFIPIPIQSVNVASL